MILRVHVTRVDYMLMVRESVARYVPYVATSVRYVQLPTPCVLVGSTSLVFERGANTHS
jgi:hypothetical protein